MVVWRIGLTLVYLLLFPVAVYVTLLHLMIFEPWGWGNPGWIPYAAILTAGAFALSLPLGVVLVWLRRTRLSLAIPAVLLAANMACHEIIRPLCGGYGGCNPWAMREHAEVP